MSSADFDSLPFPFVSGRIALNRAESADGESEACMNYHRNYLKLSIYQDKLKLRLNKFILID